MRDGVFRGIQKGTIDGEHSPVTLDIRQMLVVISMLQQTVPTERLTTVQQLTLTAKIKGQRAKLMESWFL